MKIILACMKYDYGIEERGHSYEYYNFYLSLLQLGHEVILFDFISHYRTDGKEQMNAALCVVVEQEKPDLVFFSLYKDEFDPSSILKIRNNTKTLVFFHDDTWRIKFTQFWLKYFDYFTTPDVYKLQEYQKRNINHVIHFPFGCNEKLYFKQDLPKIHDVSFVGGWHPFREWLIGKLKKAGLNVYVAGAGWPNGIVSHAEMVKIFNQSKINLNLSNSVSWNRAYLFSSPRAFVNTLSSRKIAEQIKARHFEINGCGAFQLSYAIKGLDAYYDFGKELVLFHGVDELIEKTNYYLSNENERAHIAEAGYQRTLQQHLFSSRFNHAFMKMNLISHIE